MEDKEWFALAKKGKHKELEKRLENLENDIKVEFINRRNENGKTALHIVTKSDKTKYARALLEHGADPNIQDNDGNTALHIACDKGKVVALFYLLENGGSMHSKNVEGSSPLDIAVAKKHSSIIESFIRNDVYETQSATRMIMHLGLSDESLNEDGERRETMVLETKTSLRVIDRVHKSTKSHVEGNQMPKTFQDIPVEPLHILPSELEITEETACKSHSSTFFNGKMASLDVLVKTHAEHVKQEDRIELFKNEVKAMCDLRHPSIPTLIGIIFEPLNMDFRQIYESPQRMFLHRCLFDTEDTLTEEDVLTLAMNLADALQFLHGRNYIHCSVATFSVTVDRMWRAKLGNFEQCQLQDKPLPISHLDFLYPYMAPEQLRGYSAHPANDVYGLGNIIWECIVRKPIKEEVPEKLLLEYKLCTKWKLKHFPRKWGDTPRIIIKDCLLKQAKRAKASQVFDWIDGLLKSNLVSARPSTMKSSPGLIPLKELYNPMITIQ